MNTPCCFNKPYAPLGWLLQPTAPYVVNRKQNPPLLLTTLNNHPLPFKPINKNPRKPNTPLWWPDRKPAKRALFGGCSGGAGGVAVVWGWDDDGVDGDVMMKVGMAAGWSGVGCGMVVRCVAVAVCRWWSKGGARLEMEWCWWSRWWGRRWGSGGGFGRVRWWGSGA
nr:hypothetical protein [Tanacetum cinerariifolium]